MRWVHRTAALVVAAVLSAAPVVAGAPVAGAAAPALGGAVAGPLASAPAVIVIGSSPLRWSDVDADKTPQLWRLADESSRGSLSVKAADPVTCPDDGWLTLGAGNRASARDRGSDSCSGSALQVAAAGSGATVGGFAAAYERNAGGADDTHLGALADALAAHGECVAAAGREAALGAADHRGQVARYAADARAAAGEPGFLRACPVTLLAAPASDLDEIVGQVLAHAPSEALVVVVGVSETGADPAHLHVALAHGPGFGSGALVSASTRRAPFVQLVDVAPTVLAARGVDAPPSMIGQPWQHLLDRSPLSEQVVKLRRLDVAARAQVGAIVPFWVTLVALMLVACALAWWVGRRQIKSDGETRLPSEKLARRVALACAWCALLPSASFLAGVVSWWSAPLPLLVLGLSTVAAATVLLRLAVLLEAKVWRGRPFGLAAAVGGITFAILGLDLLTGAHLQIFTMAGYSPLVAGRFAGIGNVGFGVFAAGALLFAAGLAGVRQWAAGAIAPSTGAAAIVLSTGVVAVAVDGAPIWGSDVGGVLALVPAFGVLAWLVAGARISWRRALLVGAVTIAVLALIAVVDYARPAADQTHLGRFVGELLHGGAWTTVRRKALADVDLLASSVLTMLIPLMVVVAVWLVRRPGPLLRRAFRRSWVLRPAASALLVLAVIGAVLNDSGIVIPALAVLVVLPAVMTVVVADAGGADDGAPGPGDKLNAEPPGLLR